MTQRIINLDVFHFHFVAESNNYIADFLIKVHKPLHDDHTNLTKISLKTHNAGITQMKDNSGYL